ncbi:hypothetical protein G7Z17_g5584 [Cylindrodendrum hubeiense]|uniref:BZIP domain-containing protein n=1 Tax=Cylindrodendrum hubeiense TaxID=595255 RepID=A0A9P5HBT5_9HYPO|nr:hypothetical protein G7Z17_g5584 [Cylindrodendrum hubeiense]
MDDPTARRDVVNANRRVANMTSSQIESKRSIDRANQRYCRAKRKTQMGQLQSQVDSLTRELEDTKKQLREYQEREKSWSGLAAFGSSSEGSSNGSTAPGLCTDLAFLDDGEVEDITGACQDAGLELDISIPTSQTSLVAAGFDQPAFNSDFDSFYQPASSNFAGGLNADLLDPAWQLPPSNLNHQALFQEHPSPGAPSRPLPWAGHFLLDKFNPPFMTPGTVEWRSIPPLTDATTQLDQVILTTTESLRRGGFRPPLRESPFPSISSLLNPAGQDKSSSCTISTAAAAQVGRSPVASLLGRVGFLYVLSHLLRWYICRTKESYDQLPHCLRPTLLQRTIPHPPWIDTIVWPDIRDAIIQHMDWSRFFELRAVIAPSLCVGWPHTDTRSVFETVDGKNYKLSSVFEQHLRDGSNWTVDANAAEVFPFLKPVAREPLEAR